MLNGEVTLDRWRMNRGLKKEIVRGKRMKIVKNLSFPIRSCKYTKDLFLKSTYFLLLLRITSEKKKKIEHENIFHS